MKVSEFLIKLQKLSKEDILSIKGIGETLTKNYQSFIQSHRYNLLVNRFKDLEASGLEMNVESSLNKSTNLPLSKEIICITGTFEISRTEIKIFLEKNGAKITNSVTSTTTILLAGEKAGSKLDKAKKLNIRIVQNIEELSI
jgi:DNA ligase (NAD+)